MVHSYVPGMDGRKSMIIVQLSGGLGNQLFQYALYYKLKSRGKDVKIDDVTCYETDKRRNNQISLLNIEYEKASTKEIKRMTDSFMYPWERIRRKLFGRKDRTVFEKDLVNVAECFGCENVYFQGYWQSVDFFGGVEDELRTKIFQNISVENAECERILEEIESCEAVSLHLRRGDYLGEEQQIIYGNICTEDYYNTAIKYMQDRVPKCCFYIFSNEPQWVREHFNLDNAKIVDVNNEDNGYLDMYLMSKCSHNIIANSSFSWWGAWLNKNTDKIVIGPEKWTNTLKTDNIYNGFGVVKISADGEIING